MKTRKLLTALVLLLCLALSACGAASGAAKNAVNASGGEAMDAPQAPAESAAPSEMPVPMPDRDGMAEEMPGSAAGGAYYDNTKIIRTADLSLQSTEFDAAVEGLNNLVSAQKGYFESSNFYYGGYSGTGDRWGEFTVRVPKESFDPFLSAVGDVAHVVSRDTGVQDVGEAYYDAELRLSTLKTKHERLLALLEKAELMEDIISLETALSDVEYEIQQYTSTLTRYDSLIDFSTIHIELREVTRVSDTPAQADPLPVRLGAAFTRGWHRFCDGLTDFVLWGAYNFFGILIFLAVAAAVAFVLLRIRRRRRRALTYQAPPAPPPQEPKDTEK